MVGGNYYQIFGGTGPEVTCNDSPWPFLASIVLFVNLGGHFSK